MAIQNGSNLSKLKKKIHGIKKSANVLIDIPLSFAYHVSQLTTNGGNYGSVFISSAFNTWLLIQELLIIWLVTLLFLTLTSSSIKSAQVVNGTPMPNTWARNVSLSPIFSMSSVVLAPNFSNNLLSISKITKNLNCSVTFCSTHYVFSNNLTRWLVLVKRGFLYCLETWVGNPNCSFQVNKETEKEKVMLWYCYLRHSSFLYSECLFPRLFYNNSASSFRCEQFLLKIIVFL